MMWILLGMILALLVIVLLGQDLYSRGFRAGMECQIALHTLWNKFGVDLNEKAEDWNDDDDMLPGVELSPLTEQAKMQDILQAVKRNPPETKDSMPLEEPHKRFLFFRIEAYYPVGGIGYAVEHFDLLEDAVEYAKKNRCDYVYDRAEGKEVWG
jgi:hypothetical protein